MAPRRTLASLTLALAIAACSPPADQAATTMAAVDTAAVKAAVSDVWSRWSTAVTSGSADGFAAIVTEDARIDARGAPAMEGRAAIQAGAAQAFKDSKYTSLLIAPEMTEAISNDMAYETGNYTEAYTMGGKSLTDFGRYAAAVMKGADGVWRVGYLMAFADSTVTAKP